MAPDISIPAWQQALRLSSVPGITDKAGLSLKNLGTQYMNPACRLTYVSYTVVKLLCQTSSDVGNYNVSGSVIVARCGVHFSACNLEVAYRKQSVECEGVHLSIT